MLRRLVTAGAGRRLHTEACDTLIIGGGVVGSSVAYHLAQARGSGRGITVVERDKTYANASAVLSAGGIRQQFSLKENVQMSMYGIDFVKNARGLLEVDGDDGGDDLQFQENGYLFLASSEAGKAALQRNHATQRECGVYWMELLTAEELSARFPWLNTADVTLGSLGTANEGWFDPWALLRGLRRKASALGVRYVDGEPIAATRDGARVATVDIRSADDTLRLSPRVVVNAAGAHARPALECLAGGGSVAPLPVSPRKRCIFYFRCPAVAPPPPPATPLWHAPLTVDSSGVYFRPEGRGSDTFLCGVSPDASDDAEMWDPAALSVGDADHSKLFDEVRHLHARRSAYSAHRLPRPRRSSSGRHCTSGSRLSGSSRCSHRGPASTSTTPSTRMRSSAGTRSCPTSSSSTASRATGCSRALPRAECAQRSPLHAWRHLARRRRPI